MKATAETHKPYSNSDNSIEIYADTAENAGIGICKDVSLCTDSIPHNVETGPCYSPVSSVSSA